MLLAAIQSKGKPKFNKGFKGECRLCGCKGHRSIDCWDNEKNKDKCPSNYKQKKPAKPYTPQTKNMNMTSAVRNFTILKKKLKIHPHLLIMLKRRN
jgi:hypothetical protein